MDRGYYLLYPNLYMILVSSSGVGMKSTALKIGDELLIKALPDLTIMRGKLTMKYLVDWMGQAQAKNKDGLAEVTVSCSEFKVFARGAYADSGLIEDLTHIYDNGPYEYRTGGQGVYIIEKPCINIKAASTPEWLTTGSAADFIGGGFSSRIVPVALLKDEKLIAWPEKTLVIRGLEDALLTDLTRIGQLEGQFLVTKGGKDYFEEWYKIKDKYQQSDTRMAGYYSKKHDLALKVSMILSLSLNDDLIVTEEHIAAALQLLGKMELNIPFAFQGVAWGDQAKYQDKVLMKIKMEGEISHSQLLGAFRYTMSRQDFIQIIQTLLDSEEITFKREGTAGRSKIVYEYKVKKEGA